MGDIAILANYASEKSHSPHAYNKNIIVALHAIYFLVSTRETHNLSVSKLNFKDFKLPPKSVMRWTSPMEAQSLSWVGAYKLVAYKYNVETRQFEQLVLPK